ncbi:MAG: class I SAM-dependent methyltransferase [Lachnospiraceae bacterium]|nr:class I SAM-dependent methyltransferase [Lachnospiraceae bacterium]
MKDISYDILDLMELYGADENGIRTILENGKQPELLMALSPIRENLVDWMEIAGDDRVLEIGSGYGALTGALAWKAKEVWVLDSCLENLEVNKKRHQEMGNIHYHCSDWKALMKEEKAESELQGQLFDWVFLIGPKTREASLEIGEKRNGNTWNRKAEEKAYGIRLFQRAAELVKPGGHLVIAVQNSNSIKLLAGGELDDQEIAMSLTDLQELFHVQMPGGESSFYYPLPNYKLPAAIYSNQYLPAKGELPNLFAEYEKPRYRLFSEEAAYDAICEAGGFPQFANSYLVIWKKAW